MIERSKSWLTETDELAAELDAPDIVIIDASWRMPGDGKSAREEYLEEHIPGAIFFDIDEIADTKSSLPHMLPSPEKFSSRMRSMGIGDGSRIVGFSLNLVANECATIPVEPPTSSMVPNDPAAR